jgi:glyoxylase-like metal-dependent hydrolase (beta-lactamase superfamily II)
VRGRVRGYVANKHWPAWFEPTLLELEPEPVGPFPRSLRLTEAGDVSLVPVPGHTPGQIGVLVEDGDHTVFLAGDSSYTQELMLRGIVDGVGADDGYLFSPENGQTLVRLNAEVELHGPAAFVPQLARRAVKKGWTTTSRR